MIFALLGPLATVGVLASQSAPLSAPKQGIAKSGGGQDGKTQPKADHGNQSAPEALPSSPQPTTKPCDEACQQGHQNLAIQRELAFFTLLLVIVGGLEVAAGGLQVGTMIWQAKLLKKTREDVHTQAEWMKTQAGHMKDQTKILGESVAAAQTSADAAKSQIQMVKDKERAQLRIEFEKPNIMHSNLGKSLSIRYTVTLDGSTRATILQAMIAARMSPPEEDRQCFAEMDIPRIILPGHTTISGYVQVSEDDVSHPPIRNEQVIESFKNSEAFIIVEGEIRYQDVFRDAWVSPFILRWESDALYGGHFSTGSWTPVRGRARNQERREDSDPGDFDEPV